MITLEQIQKDRLTSHIPTLIALRIEVGDLIRKARENKDALMFHLQEELKNINYRICTERYRIKKALKK